MRVSDPFNVTFKTKDAKFHCFFFSEQHEINYGSKNYFCNNLDIFLIEQQKKKQNSKKIEQMMNFT